MSKVGKFVWYDLMTKDEAAAKAFYTSVLPWAAQVWDGPMPYTMWTVEGTPIGGVMQLPPEAGAPPHWLGYVGVDNVDATAARVVALGGTVLRPATEIPNAGTFAVVADPQGAAFALYKSSNPSDAALSPDALGAFSWAELNTTDWEAAWKFYTELFGWKHTTSMEMGPGKGTYFMFQREGDGDRSMGGMSNMANMMGAPPHWLFYVNVEKNIDAAIERVRKRDGKLVHGPMDIHEGGSKIAICADPQGAFFALYAE
jgi:predicted enzyme related to lactoylglutathione lyase